MRRSNYFTLAAVAAAGLLFAASNAHAQAVCDDDAGDPAENTPEWTQRDANNVECGNQKAADADASPAFQAKYNEQLPIEQLECATVTAREWPPEPNRYHGGAGAVPQSKVTDPFRSPEEW